MSRDYQPLVKDSEGKLRFAQIDWRDGWNVNIWGSEFWGRTFQELGFPCRENGAYGPELLHQYVGEDWEHLKGHWPDVNTFYQAAAKANAVIKDPEGWDLENPDAAAEFEEYIDQIGIRLVGWIQNSDYHGFASDYCEEYEPEEQP